MVIQTQARLAYRCRGKIQTLKVPTVWHRSPEFNAGGQTAIAQTVSTILATIRALMINLRERQLSGLG
jgi:hypothetical protein